MRFRLNGLEQVAIRSPRPGQPRQRQRICPRGQRDARNFGQRACHERRLGVLAVAQTVADADAQRDDVLERAA